MKSTFDENDFYDKKLVEPEPVKIENSNDSNIYEIEKIIAKKMMYIERDRRRKAHFEFRIKWFE